ncbi:DUF86 domain-containing protein [Patescibacteria group bacterium]|nr:DUF86 domain-containing protein [Patescibacteria group bacterium]MBU1199901.1 DUF86 domain-containing protein [Patescibacteria group bacterium]MBU1256437.1 DUF86 domain-containing protein [Patescibacteria group bacterium]MBU1457328.1 DUF86 domain-containing protein [Patescibacteria group bacterium]
MKKNPKVFLQHILESISEIEKYTKNISETKFARSTQIQDAVIRRLEIIGEAAKNIPDNIKKCYEDIPWKKITGSRDVLIHGYFRVDIESVWDTVTKDICKLKKDIKKIIKEL